MRGRVEIELTVTGIPNADTVTELIRRAEKFGFRVTYSSPLERNERAELTVSAPFNYDPVTVWDVFAAFVRESGITA